MRKVSYSNQFAKDLKKVKSQKGYNETELKKALEMLQAGESLPLRYKDHKLSKNSSNFYLRDSRDFHLRPNICIVYRITESELTVLRIGSHPDLGLTDSLKVI